jgi:hypothetical protein
MEVQSDGIDPTATRLSSRAKLIRVATTTGVVVLALVLILVQTGALRFLPPNSGEFSTIEGKAPLRLSPASWQQIDLPAPRVAIESSAVDPYNPGFIVFCAIGASPGKYGNVAVVWITTNSGRSWASSSVPYREATFCAVTILTGTRSTVLVQADSGVDNLSACSSARFFVSGDLGMSWFRIPHKSIAPLDSQGDCSAWGSAEHLFIETDYEAATGSQEFQTLLERSDDSGRTWRRIALPFQSSLSVDILHSSDDNVLVADALLRFPGLSQLWISRNGGSSWSLIGEIPDSAAPDMIAPLPSVGSNQSMPPILYAEDGAQAPASLYSLSLWMVQSGHWSLIPPLPVAGAQASRTGLTNILGELPDGRLLALGADPAGSLSISANPDIAGLRQWLWIWNPSKMGWRSLPTPTSLTWPGACDALCWQAQISLSSPSNAGSGSSDYYVYLISYDGDGQQHMLYRVLI